MRSILIVALATVIGSTTAVLAQSSRDLTEPTGTEANRAKQQLGAYYGYYGGVYRSHAYVCGACTDDGIIGALSAAGEAKEIKHQRPS